MNQVHLLIPKLLSPLKLWNKDFAFEPESNILSKLLANSQTTNTPTNGLHHTLFNTLGLADKAELPIAHYRYQLDFGTTPDCHIMCADPVNLQAGIDEIILNANTIDDLSKADAEEFIEGLNKHFAQDNWEFIVTDSGNWYLKHHSDELIHTTPLDHARGKSIFKHLPQSETLNWHSLQNEIQMLLHMASLNQSREIAGQLPINSLWFWGAGKATTLQHKVNTIWSDSNDTAIKAAALAANIICQSLTELPSKLTGEHIVILDSLYTPALMDDYESWQQQLHSIEAENIPNIEKICKRNHSRLIINDCDGNKFIKNQKGTWKFWKKTKHNLLDLC